MYQPCEKEKYGKIPMATVQAIMAVMVETSLFGCITGGRKWMFDSLGGWPDAVTGRVDRGEAYCLHHSYHAATGVAVRLCMYTCIDRWVPM